MVCSSSRLGAPRASERGNRLIADLRRCAQTLINSQETCLVSGLAAARQLGADYPFADAEARRSFSYYGSIMYGARFRKARG